MISLNKSECWYEPINFFRKEKDYKRQMYRDDHAFLSGLLKRIKPHKIVELGVAEGGTTRMILKTLEMMEHKCKMFSVDLEEIYKGNKVGYTITEDDKNEYVDHTLMLGKYLMDRLEEIGPDIDFLILDTTHLVPGDILEFLCALPYLTKDAYVVVHDINLSTNCLQKDRVNDSFYLIADKVLFSSVTANKFFNKQTLPSLNNIGAFQINEDTYKNISDVFYTLSFIWTYDIKKDIREKYRNFLLKRYDSDCMEIYDLFAKEATIYKDKVESHIQGRKTSKNGLKNSRFMGRLKSGAAKLLFFK